MQHLLASQVGPYTVRVDALVGEGGFASIYRAQDQTTTQVRMPAGRSCPKQPQAEGSLRSTRLHIGVWTPHHGGHDHVNLTRRTDIFRRQLTST